MTIEQEHAGSKLVFNVVEAAVQLGVGRTTVYELIRSGELPSFKIGQRRLIAAKDLTAFVDAASRGQVA